MSRIDEGLRRARGLLDDRGSLGVGTADLFVSPWSTGRDHAGVESPPIPSSGSAVRRVEPRPRTVPPPVRPSIGHDFLCGWRERLITSDEADQLLVHQFRRLVATLLQAQGNAPLKTVMITSAAPGDGKTLTALNLALMLSESYRRRVLLVEGDLRRPAICAAAGLPTSSEGLSEVIKSPDDRKVSLIQLTDLLTLMPAGKADPDPLSGLTSPRMGRLLAEASEQFEWVILDTPPLGAAPDASLMVSLVDAVLLVVRAGETQHAAVQHAIETLGADRILGVVLNAVDAEVVSEHHDYYGHYSPTA